MAKTIYYTNDLISHIHDNIYIGNWDDSLQVNALVEKNIKHIICINTNKKSPYILSRYEKNGISHKQFEFEDDEDVDITTLLNDTSSLLQKIHESKENVLIHCGCGISRAPTVAINYLRILLNDLDKAIALVKTKRPISAPNNSFLLQLKN